MLRVINRIWLGGTMPENYRQFGVEWEYLNPGWSVHDWTEEEILDTDWLNQGIINRMHEQSKQPGADLKAYYTHVADVVDYELMLQGGFYFNTDIKPLRPLELLDLEHPGAGMEDEEWPVNAAMWAPEPNMEVWQNAVDMLPGRYYGNPGAFMNYTTGPHLLRAVIDQYQGPFTLWPRNVFNPIHWSQFEHGTVPDYEHMEYPEESIAVHIWEHRTSQRGQRILET